MNIPQSVIDTYTEYLDLRKTGEITLRFKEGILQQIQEVKVKKP